MRSETNPKEINCVKQTTFLRQAAEITFPYHYLPARSGRQQTS